eukprot:2388937-Rhodomonas_salina.1
MAAHYSQIIDSVDGCVIHPRMGEGVSISGCSIPASSSESIHHSSERQLSCGGSGNGSTPSFVSALWPLPTQALTKPRHTDTQTLRHSDTHLLAGRAAEPPHLPAAVALGSVVLAGAREHGAVLLAPRERHRRAARAPQHVDLVEPLD